MRLRNDQQSFGLVSVLLHWVMALLIIGLFALGKFIVDLDYYDPWYKMAPDLHLGVGMIVALMLIVRLAWRLSNPHPQIIGERWEQYVALSVHRLFYLLLAGIFVSGYLITTADGKALALFDWFDIPATLYGYENQEDIAGVVHEWLSNALVALVTIHTLATLKHHFINRDSTLRRMLGLSEARSSSSTTTKP